MDGSRFDAISRAVVARPSRRYLTRLLGGLAVGGPLELLGHLETTAKGKHKKRRKRKRCVPNCYRKICGDDGCGGSCGSCAPPETCQGGVCGCHCSSGKVCLRNGTCAIACLDNTDCPAIGCNCSGANREGQQACIAGGPGCGSFPTCTSTGGCPQGMTCIPCPALPELRCWPLC